MSQRRQQCATLAHSIVLQQPLVPQTPTYVCSSQIPILTIYPLHASHTSDIAVIHA